MLDTADRLYDPRLCPPEPIDFEVCPDCKNPYEPHSSWCPTHPSEGYLAMRAWHDGPDGTPCPVCEAPKPEHERGCYELPEGEPSYRMTPADFQPGGHYFNEDF